MQKKEEFIITWHSLMTRIISLSFKKNTFLIYVYGVLLVEKPENGPCEGIGLKLMVHKKNACESLQYFWIERD